MPADAPVVSAAPERDARSILDAARRDARPVLQLTRQSTPVLRGVVAWPGEPPVLSLVIPAFERLGLTVVDHQPYERSLQGFTVSHPVELGDDALRLAEQAFAAAWSGDCESDEFSRLVLTADLTWRQVSALRAASFYLRQAGLGLSPPYIAKVLAGNAEFARAWTAAFEARFDPAASSHTGSDQILDDLVDRAPSLDEDRILGSLVGVLRACVRTNYFQRGEDGRPKRQIVLKLESGRLPFLPQPRPLVETFVHSARTEGLHLRGGRVSRGGIRWSDRAEDYRVEVLGLMRAQMVKNAVIVPSGAKGAFVVKRDLAGLDRAAVAEAVRASYTEFVNGLLDVTDNIVDGVPLSPMDTVAHDEPDPYLVLAADKGTATFSDLANALAAERGFWLGDAFASGGSRGYDHKAMGITARGAWVSVRRHFRECGVAADTDPITVVGVGDMSGDVFGNGMLLSQHIRLIGAFDHRHIFLDPDPDPAASYAQRQHLFVQPHSSWADYDRTAISPGGGVFDRSAKVVPLSPEVRSLLEISGDRPTPDEVIGALLRARTDLLWFGGIGTYVKASTETHADAGDKANDTVRVDAGDLRCQVIGEGANLAITQRARIEYAEHGGRINADFIDNSAGVDTSDREVNLKILLAAATDEITPDERDAILLAAEREVADSVLADNELQARAISVVQARAPLALDRHAQLIHNLETLTGLDRRLAQLPDDAEIADRRARGVGLTRPEIAVLLAHSKNIVREELLDSPVPDQPDLAHVLARYFPSTVRTRFARHIAEHPLAREIIATQLANDLINHVGPGFVYRIEELTGAPTPDATLAYATVRQLFDLDSVWTAIDALGETVPLPVQVRMEHEVQNVIESGALWLLRHRRLPLLLDQEIATLRPTLATLTTDLVRLLGGQRRAKYDATVAELTAHHVDPAIAARVALCEPLATALDVVDGAVSSTVDITALAAHYYRLDHTLRVDVLREHLADRPDDRHWTLMAKAALRDDLREGHLRLALAAAQNPRRELRTQRYLDIVAELDRGEQATVDLACVALRELRLLDPPFGDHH